MSDTFSLPLNADVIGSPADDELWFLPLGGCGEIGMNLNLYGAAGRWLMVDCGITFAREGDPGPKIQMADPQFIEGRRHDLAALVITHAHEDHVGAVADLWPRLRCPIYTTAFTAEILRRKCLDAGLTDVPLHVVEQNSRLALDPFVVTWVPVTHSTPESFALLIETPVGRVFHTGDWKLDESPVVGRPFQASAYRAVGDRGVLAMVCDSTNATLEGRSISEGELYAGLRQAVDQAAGRVVVGCFGSNVARLHTLARIASDTGRYTALSADQRCGSSNIYCLV